MVLLLELRVAVCVTILVICYSFGGSGDCFIYCRRLGASDFRFWFWLWFSVWIYFLVEFAVLRLGLFWFDVF